MAEVGDGLVGPERPAVVVLVPLGHHPSSIGEHLLT